MVRPSATLSQTSADLILNLSASQQKVRLSAARALGQAADASRPEAFRALVERLPIEDKVTVRVAILRSLVRLRSGTDAVVRVVRPAQEDSEPAVRDEAITSAGRAFITGTGELAAAILPLVSRGGCDRLPTVDAGSDPASSDHLLDNIKYVLMTQSLSNDMDQCITTMVRSYVSSPARSLGLLGTLSKAKDKSAAVRVALAILDGCRSDPGAQAACVSAARVLQT